MTKFKVGDMVFCDTEVGELLIKNLTGRVVKVGEGGVHVDWLQDIDGHDCSGLCPENQGWYVNLSEVVIGEEANWKERMAELTK